MANISSFYGEMHIKKEVLDVIRKDLAEYVASPPDRCYGIDYFGVEPEEILKCEGDLSFTFEGNGRWSYWTMLQDGYGTIDNQEILRKLWEKGYQIEIDFWDYEPGCEILYGSEGRLIPERIHDEFVFLYKEEVLRTPDYTIPNLEKWGFCEAEYDVRDDISLDKLLDDAQRHFVKFWKFRNDNGEMGGTNTLVVEDKEAVREFMLKHEYYDGLCTFDDIDRLLMELEEENIVKFEEEEK